MKRFWVKVDKTGDCWNWTAFCKNGYGQFRLNNKMQRAHRVSWELNRGPIPDGLCVLHKCDNRRCVRPSHLFLGTYKDNSDDKVNKNRQSKGLKHRILTGKPKTAKVQSRFKGVDWYKRTGKWHARAQHNGKKIHLGYFDTEEDAYSAYKRFIDEGKSLSS